MAIVLLIAGIGFLFAGLAAVGFGIPINEFSFGNTLILAGSITACSGMILIGLWTVLRELTRIAQRLGPGEPAIESSTASSSARSRVSESDLFGGGQSVGEKPADQEAPSAASPAPWQEEAARDRGRSDAPSAPAEEPAPPKRRNLMFSSSRKERERERAKENSAPLTEARLDLAPLDMPPPATFEDAWPQPERSRAPETPPRRASRPPSTFTETAAGADRYTPPAAQEELPPVTVLKSGVVDGMAYSLYSDGSIEAQMPEGMMRFTSIDELRSHLDQRP